LILCTKFGRNLLTKQKSRSKLVDKIVLMPLMDFRLCKCVCVFLKKFYALFYDKFEILFINTCVSREPIKLPAYLGQSDCTYMPTGSSTLEVAYILTL
jgi:hypothetical protein